MRNILGRKETAILNRLLENGYEAMIVGGAVRDVLLGKKANDVDIATNAPYKELVKLMKGLGELKFAGKAFGVLLVGGIEVATYRIDNYNRDGGTTLETQPTSSALKDSKRRDFTINAIYYSYGEDFIYDFQQGAQHLKEKLLKTVGNPYERFHEDYSRILRALYLASSLNFKIDEETGQAIKDLAHNVVNVPGALQGKIIRKVIEKGCFSKFLRLLKEYDVLQYVFPEMVHTVGMGQNPKYHKFDVWNHTLAVVESAEKSKKASLSFVMGAFLHDVAKGTEGIRGISKSGHLNDIGHERAGVPIAKEICHRLELPKKAKKEILILVRWHGNRIAPTEKSVKKFLLKFKNNYRNVSELISAFNTLTSFMLCDADGFADGLKSEVTYNVLAVRKISVSVFKNQIFYSNQFDFEASLIAQHKNVKTEDIEKWIEFFIKNNISNKERVLKVLNKK